ncbi:uncharacterized protein ATC70_001965 [Mucor velutinosus]|uniref:Homeobox domain-containing protein n=1 Tax=Mucor velutinosus TaxID=708070 RepID=A0AAN7I013_9FUNG|nr:hypothetical protein ATC70_001965 [Mucor velutinosus]
MTLDTLQPFEQFFTVSPASTSTSTPTTASTKSDDNYLLETFHQYPHGDFRPTFYNPFEIKHRRRTSRAQLKVLEKSYLENPKPSAAIRRILAQKLEMTPRGIQIWFQNRRAKAKLLRRKSSSTPSVVASAVETEEEEEEEQEQQQAPYHFDDGMNATNTSLNTGDINQSSILFSQFFTNNYAVAGVDYANVTAPIEAEDEDWRVWQLNDNIRTVATTAAAVAAASSSGQQQQQSEMRRRSCPIMPPAPRQHQHQQINMALNQPQASYLSPVWSPNMLCNIMSPMPPQAPQQQYKRNFSYDSSSFDFLAYSQHTPPLTASCSASTVAGSPISLDSLYMNDPVVLPTNQYYNQSPLSATTTYIPDYTMPQFI